MNVDSSASMTQRLLVAPLPVALLAAAEGAASRQGAAVDALVVDAIEVLAAMVDVGMTPTVPPAGSETPRLLHARVPNWAMGRLDALVGATPDLVDRVTVVRAALAAHLSGLDAGQPAPMAEREAQAPVWPLAPQSLSEPRSVASQMSAPPIRERGPSRHRDSLDVDVRRAERARARLSSLASGRAMGRDPLPVATLAAPYDIANVPPLPPSDVTIGLAPAMADRALKCEGFSPLPRDRSRDEMSLYGLTNRVSPTLWAASQLIEMQVEQGGEPVPYSAFLARVMPAAWRIGAGMEAWEANERSNPNAPTRRFLSSARWPSVPNPSDPPLAERREASTVYGFVEYALLIWMAGSRQVGPGGGRGPLVALGLVDAEARDDGAVFLSATSAALRLAVSLGRAGASCEYPQNADSWLAYEEFLAEANPLELERMDTMLDIIATADDRAGVFRGAERIDPQVHETASGSATLANGYIARLREWGLLEPVRPKFGMGALTSRGVGELGNARNAGRVIM